MAGWFRYYDEALDDPKVQRLSDADFKAWVNLLCVANRNGGRWPDEDGLGFALRMDRIAIRSLLDRLSIAGLIDRVKGGANGWSIAPHGWSKRQYKSDSSTERVQRFRNVSSAVSETPPEQSRNRAEQKETPSGVSPPVSPDIPDIPAVLDRRRLTALHFEAFWDAYPKRCGTNSKSKAEEKFTAAVKSGVSPEAITAGALRYSAHCDAERKTGTEFVQQAVTWLNQRGWESEYVKRSGADRQQNGSADEIKAALERFDRERKAAGIQ